MLKVHQENSLNTYNPATYCTLYGLCFDRPYFSTTQPLNIEQNHPVIFFIFSYGKQAPALDNEGVFKKEYAVRISYNPIHGATN